MVRSLRLQATMATLWALPRARRHWLAMTEDFLAGITFTVGGMEEKRGIL